MNHNDLLSQIDLLTQPSAGSSNSKPSFYKAIRAVVELHKPVIHALPDETCLACQDFYPCPTIQAIEKELGGDAR